MSEIRRIGRYPVLEEIGRGGMGVVYRAYDPKLDRAVAIKVLSEHFAENPDKLSGFEREARTMARFNHPHIATIYGLEEAPNGNRFLVLEFVEGENLAARLLRAPPGMTEVLRMGTQVCAALEAAHQRGIVHRDLKPENVLLNLDDEVKVLDFGIAKTVFAPTATFPLPTPAGETVEVSPPGDSSATGNAESTIMGTPGYMSPEQVRGLPVDKRSDLFAFGCLLYECLTGRKAFPAQDLSGLIHATLETDPDFSVLPATTPTSVVDLLRRCLRKNPAEREVDARSARRALEIALGATSTDDAGRPVEAPHNLPTALSSFVGRERELAEIETLCGGTRLLTLTGSGGCGKTRLAIRLGDALRVTQSLDGIWLIELGVVSNPDLLPTAFLTTLHLREEPQRSPVDLVVEFLRSKRAVLIIDNCEHLLRQTARIAETILSACPHTKIVATSREGLGLPGETNYLVPSLSVADAGELRPARLERYESVRLFVERARAAKPGFRLRDDNAPHVAEICQRLDGIPLAIELAAARVRAMSPAQIAARLNDSFRLLTGGSRTALPRQQTMRATFDWSYRLLSAEEQLLLQRMSVFAGGATLETAEAVCSDRFDPSGGASPTERPSLLAGQVLDVLTALVEKSLVIYEEGREGSPRYRLLETGRQFGREELANAGDADRMRERHLEYFLALAEEASPHLIGTGQKMWLGRLEREHENLRAALEWCACAEDGAARAIRLAGSIWRKWTIHGQAEVGTAILTEALDRYREATQHRAVALDGLGVIARYQGDFANSDRYHRESLAISRSLGDRGGIAQALYSRAYLALLSHYQTMDLEAAREYLEESLAIFRELGNPSGIGKALSSLGWVAFRNGDLDTALTLSEESLAIRRSLGDRHGVGSTLSSLAFIAKDRGDHPRARALLEESLAIFRELNAQGGVGWVLSNLGLVGYLQGDYGVARSHLEESLAIQRGLGDKAGIAMVLSGLVYLAEETGDDRQARSWLREGLQLAQELGLHMTTFPILEATALMLARLGATREAARLYGAADAIRERGAGHSEETAGEHRSAREEVRGVLGAAFDRAIEEGRKLTFAQAVEVSQGWLETFSRDASEDGG